MQSVSSNLQTELDKGQSEPRVLVDLYEWYDPDYVPGVDGFDPADATETFAAQEITWNGIAYRRELKSRSDVNKSMTEKTNSVSQDFSNISRYMAALAQSQTIEGKLLCIRTVCPTVTDDSLVLFHGRCEKPGDIDKKDFPLSARQDFGNINQEIPPRKFLAEDPEGRTPSDPLYEGFRLLSTAGSFILPVTTPSTGFFGRLFGRKSTKNETRQFSSVDNTPFGSVVPMQFGRVQMELINIYFIDEGYNLGGIWVIGEGRIDEAIVTVHNDYLQQVQENHYGDPGGTGTNTFTDPRIGSPLSNTAYTRRSMYGSPGDVVEEAPLVTAIVRGLRIPIPNSSGVFDSTAWSDNPVNIARFILTDPRLVNMNSGFMEDAVNYATGLHCDEPLIDDTNSQLIPIPNADLPEAGVGFARFRSTGQINSRAILYGHLGDTSIIPELADGPYVGFDPLEPPDLPDPPDPLDPPTAYVSQRLLRKRYTTNVPITDTMKAVDFLYKVVNPSAKLFYRVNKKGKLEIRSEKSADHSYLRAATAVGATSITIQDVTPWKSGDLLVGRLLMGFNLLTSEVRNISSAVYSADGNGLTLTAGVTGTITATASGATLSGGSTTVQASGTVTIGGAPAAGNIVTVTINGIAVSYTLSAEDTTSTVASLLASWINATPRLRPYIRASWLVGSPTVVTIKCLYGAITLDSALLKTHAGPIADPTVAPTVAASAGGSLPAGTWKLAYSNVNSIGSTALTPLASIVVTVDQKIDVSGLPALPAGITARNFFLSDQAGSTNLKFSVQRVNASDFSTTAFPEGTAAIPPSFNTTGEELIRIAMSFATNSQDVYPAWRASTAVLVSDVYLPTVLNGHKYDVSAITTGITAATEPTWPTTAGGTVVDGGVTWTEAGSTVLKQAGLTRANVVKDSLSWPKGSTQLSVNRIKFEFRDTTNDFALTPKTVSDPIHFAQVKKWYTKEINLEAVDSLHQALRLANAQLAKDREGDWFASWTAGPSALPLEEGDVTTISDDSGGLINVAVRIEEIRIKPNHEVAIMARKYSTNMFSDDVGAQTITLPSTLRLSVTADSIVEFIDNFPIRDADGLTPGFYVAVSRDLSVEGDWRGWALYADYGDGYGDAPIAEGDIPAVMGTATTTLGTVADPTVFDEVNSLTFTLKYGPPSPFPNPFSTVTEADLIANPRRNLFLVGDEYLQAATVVDNGSQSYTISDFYRGRFGTDGPELAHGASERVVYLDGSEVFVAIDPSRVGLPFNYKAVTTNQDVADADPVSFTWTGGTVKPYRVTDLSVVRDDSGDWLISATGRPRPSEEPASYMARIRRVSDGVTMRDMPITPGMTLAAIFKVPPSGNIPVVDRNNVSGAAAGASTALARQVILGPGTSVQAIVTLEGQAVSANFIDVDLIDANLPDTGVGNWTGVTHRYMIRSVWDQATKTTSVELNDGSGDPPVAVTIVGPGPILVRILFVGSEVRFYASTNLVAASPVPPFAIGKQPLIFPLQVRVTLSDPGPDNKVENVTIGGINQPATIYALRQQQSDDGQSSAGAGLTTIDVEFWQVSRYAGIQGASVREVF